MPTRNISISLGVLLVCFLFVRTLVYSPFGQSLTGIRENLLRMHAVGSPVRRRLVICYTISAAIAGIAGGLWAQTNAYVNLSALDLDRAATVLIVLILGGYGRLYGAFIGAVVYLALEHFLARDLSDRLAARPRRAAGGDRAVCAQRDSGPRRGAVAALPRAWRARRIMTEIRLETRALSRHFGALVAVHDIDFKLAAGARHALIGPNGAGKTTFINLLTGVLPPTQRPRAARRAGHHRQGAGRAGQARHRADVPDQPAVPRALRSGKCLHLRRRALGAAPSMFYPAGRRTDVIEESMHLLEMLKLADVARHRVSELPYGRQRLVELAIAIGLKPEVLLLDEPAAGVPSAESHIILDAIERLPEDIAVLIIEHDMDVVFRFAKRVTVMVGGAVFAEGTPREIEANPQVRAIYLGQAGQGAGRMASALELRHVSAGYGETVVLEDIDLTLAPGECISVIGRNGVGKTTLLATVMGHTTLHSGDVMLDGQRPQRHAALSAARSPASASCRRSARFFPR